MSGNCSSLLRSGVMVSVSDPSRGVLAVFVIRSSASSASGVRRVSTGAVVVGPGLAISKRAASKCASTFTAMEVLAKTADGLLPLGRDQESGEVDFVVIVIV